MTNMWGGAYGFLDPEHLLARHVLATGKLAEFDVTDLRGQVIDTWNTPKSWLVRDIGPDRRILAVFPDDRAYKTLIVEYPSKKVVQSRVNPGVSGLVPDLGAPGMNVDGRLGVYFAESGKPFARSALIPLPNVGTWIPTRGSPSSATFWAACPLSRAFAVRA